MSANKAPPNFEQPKYFDYNPQSPGYGRLWFLAQYTTPDATHVPYCWGFTIYRATKAVAGQDPEADARFAEGLRRFEAIVCWYFLYTKKALGIRDTNTAGHIVADRFWNEIIEDYPDREAVVAGLDVPNGAEDFSPVGRAFIASVAVHGKPEMTGLLIRERLQLIRNTKCLIIDDKSLDTLLTLPKEPPHTAPEDTLEAYRVAGGNSVWLWVLDLETMQAREDGKPLLKLSYQGADEKPYPPWARMLVSFVAGKWFERPALPESVKWSGELIEDKIEWKTVLYWHADLVSWQNEFRRNRRKNQSSELGPGGE